MTIDERLDRLTIRHEALTETVELLVRASVKYDAMLTRHDDVLAKHDEALTRHEELLGRVIRLADDLTHLAQNHERRISGLEGGRA